VGPLSEYVDSIDMVDHPKDRCFYITIEDAYTFGRWYDRGIGRRWGVPYDRWTIVPGRVAN